MLTALRLKTTVFDAGKALYPNGERHLRTRLRLARLYPPELLAETCRLADLCRFSIDELRYEYPEEIVPEGHTPTTWLRHETEAGLLRRYPAGVPSGVRERIEHELQLIAELRYEAYFLTVYDIVCFARREDILCQGRDAAGFESHARVAGNQSETGYRQQSDDHVSGAQYCRHYLDSDLGDRHPAKSGDPAGTE